MNELKLTLEITDQVQFWGANNEHYELVKAAFPKLKIVARGNDVKALGDEAELKLFEQKFEQLVAHLEKYRKLSSNDVDTILGSKKTIATADETPTAAVNSGEVIVFGNHGLMIKARTANQRRMVDSIGKNDVLFAIGPAGTGKTYTAVALAVRALKNKEIKRIILTRPAVEAGESLGFLPGDLKEKVDPYLRPLYDALYDMLGVEQTEKLMEKGVIEIAPLAYMRGRTLEDAYVILDEAQNTTDNQMKMFLTRLGFRSKMIVTGDISQIDLPRNTTSGLIRALDILEGVKGISFIHLSAMDVVRHPVVQRIIERYDGNNE